MLLVPSNIAVSGSFDGNDPLASLAVVVHGDEVHPATVVVTTFVVAKGEGEVFHCIFS